MIMCFMGALRPDLMVATGTNPTDPVTYLALVDEAQCDSSGVFRQALKILLQQQVQQQTLKMHL